MVSKSQACTIVGLIEANLKKTQIQKNGKYKSNEAFPKGAFKEKSLRPTVYLPIVSDEIPSLFHPNTSE